MKSLLTIAGLMIFALSTSAHAGGVSNAKVAELSAHRIDRLVALNKIDASFMNKLDKMEVTVVENQPPVHFKVRVSQTKPAQGTPLQMDISFDDDGKPLAFQVIPGGTAGPDLGWSDKDAVSLSENCLHYVLENNTDAKVALFDKGLATFSLSRGTLNGQAVARGQMTSSLSSEKLNVYLMLDGTFISAEIVP